MPKATQDHLTANADPQRVGGAAALENPCTEALRLWSDSQPDLAHARWAVAYSGGADSTALLLAARFLQPELVAFHVNHGLQTAAQHFEKHARETCERLGVQLAVVQAHVRCGPSLSVEAEARKARYAALVQLAKEHDVGCVLLAHHLDDQVESMCLAWLRGSGLRGLAAMPTVKVRDGVAFQRPLLGVRGTDIRQWLHQEGIAYVDDPTNASTDHLRNAIRLELMPVLERLAPSYRRTLARTAGHMAQAQRLLDVLAAQDLSVVGIPPLVKRLQVLDSDRLANALRYWLYSVHGCSPSAAQLAELVRQVHACSTKGHRIELRIGHGSVLRDGACIQYLP